MWTRWRRRAGAFPRLEEMMDDGEIYLECGTINGSVIEFDRLCTRAELWAAIEALDRCATIVGGIEACDGTEYECGAEWADELKVEYAQASDRIRALLGLDAPA